MNLRSFLGKNSSKAFLAASLWSVSAVIPALAVPGLGELYVWQPDAVIADAQTFTGDGFVAVTPNSGALHRNAVVVDGGTLGLLSGGSLTVLNNNDLTAFLRVGYFGTSGTLNVVSGSSVQVGQASRYANFIVGEGVGASGLVNQTGGAVLVKGSFNVGEDGGTGVYNISSGTLTIDHADNPANHTSLATLGLNLNTAGPLAGTTSGTLNLSGTGSVILTAHQWDPSGHPGEYGTVNFILGNRDNGVAGRGDGNGTINQTGGTFRVENGAQLFLSSVGNGVYNLSGGTLEIGGDGLRAKYGNGSGTYDFNLGTATLRVIGSNLVTSVDADLVGGKTFTFDTAGLDASWSGNFVGAGLHQIDFGGNSFVKTGLGTLTVSGTNTFDSAFVIGGKLRVNGGSSSAVEFAVGSGKTSGTPNTGAFQIDSGTFSIGQSTRADNTTVVAGSFRIGDFGGVGTFTQNGGSVVVGSNSSLNIGNQGGSGVYNLAGGSLVLNDGLHVLGRSQGSNPASQGVLNISGGTLTLQNGGALILGNDVRFLAGTSSVLNQTGGVLHVDNDSLLFLAGFTDGKYNLTGGTLEIGGNSLRNTRGGSPAYDFNVGGAAGATIKVTGSALTTSANITLNAAGYSIVDTNGLGATLSGNLVSSVVKQIDDGGNAFAKTGLGTLTLSGATRTFGTFYTVGGTTAQTAGATTASELMVGSGVGSTASYTMSGGTLTINPTTKGDNVTVVTGSFRVGDFGGTGTFTQTGGTVTVSEDSALNIGNQGGTGVYNLNGGTLTLIGGNSVIGRSTANKGVSNGTLNITAGTLNLTGGASLINGNNTVPGAGVSYGASTITQTGGTLHVDNDSLLALAGFGTGLGVYNLNGGTLEIGGSSSFRPQYNNNTAAYAFNFGSATIKVFGADLTSSVDTNLTAGKISVIDTNGLNASWSGDLVAAGLHQVDFGGNSFKKTGLGRLTLSGVNTLDSAFALGGEWRQTGGSTSSVEFAVGSGIGSTALFTMSGGSVTVAASTRADNTTPVSGAFRVGDFGGAGTFTQTGGTVTVAENSSLNIGNQGGAGVYNLQGGNLVLNYGLHVIGRSHGSNPASNGTLNISGGTLTVRDTGELIIGEDTHYVAGNSAVLNQTGGVLHVDNDSTLFLTGFTDGTYNLTGGTLEIGGSSSIATTRGGAGVYHWNLGGGAIKVTGSDLVTGARATLLADTTSTINTNGFNAAFTNGFAGNGAFAKTGAGTLALGGTTESSGASTVVDTLVIGGTDAGAGSLVLDDGATLTATSQSGRAGRILVGDGATGTLAVHEGAGVSVGSPTGTADGLLSVGTSGATGTLTLDGGDVTFTAGTGRSNTFQIGSGEGSKGYVNQSAGTVTLNGGALTVGALSGHGEYNLSGDAAFVASTGATVTVGAGVGDAPGDTLDGLVAVAENSSFIAGTLANRASRIAVGVDGGIGVFGVTGDGELSLVASNRVSIGDTGVGAVFVGGGSVTLGGTNGVAFGDDVSGTGGLIQSGGTFTSVGGRVYVGYSGTGRFTLDGGVTTIGAGGLTLAQNEDSTGTIDLNSGGTLEIGGTNGFTKGAGTAAFNLGGGTLRITSALTSNLSPVLVDSTASTIDTNGFSAAFSGGVSGTGSLVKTGAGLLSLGTGASSVGDLKLSGGSITAGSIEAESYTLESGTLTADLSGGTLTKNGSGTVSISGNNTYSDTVVNAGTLVVLTANSLSTGAVTLNNGTLDLNGHNRTVASVDFNGGSVVGGTLTSLAGLGTGGSGDNTISGNLGGSAGFSQAGSGTTTLSGDNSGYSGEVHISNGTLVVGSDNALGSGAVTLNDGTLKIQSGSASVTNLSGTGGALQIGSSTHSVTLNNSSSGTFSGSISGAGGLVIAGNGTFTANGDLSGYTGAARVSSGSTFVLGTHGAPVIFGGSLTVGSGGALAGNGSFLGHVVISGDHNPGNSPGIQTFNAGLAYDGGTLTMQLSTPAGGVAAAGTDFDRINVTGGLAITGGTTLVLTPFGALSYADAYWTQSHSFELIHTDGITGVFALDDTSLAAGSSGFGAWSLTQDGQSVTANWTVTPVPEPSTYGLLGAGTLAAAALVRRRRRRVPVTA